MYTQWAPKPVVDTCTCVCTGICACPCGKTSSISPTTNGLDVCTSCKLQAPLFWLFYHCCLFFSPPLFENWPLQPVCRLGTTPKTVHQGREILFVYVERRCKKYNMKVCHNHRQCYQDIHTLRGIPWCSALWSLLRPVKASSTRHYSLLIMGGFFWLLKIWKQTENPVQFRYPKDEIQRQCTNTIQV